MLLMIDNYDSFTYNLVQYLGELGEEVRVVRNDELEPERRGVYAGAVGHIGFQGNIDLAIAIRTGVVKDGMLHVQAAAGIVADSVPEQEWLETRNKARALLAAAELTNAGLDAPAA